nr:hypothetical protein [Vibrio parahaemolyticus]
MLLHMKVPPIPLNNNWERDSRVCDRITAVLITSEGWSSAMISHALRINVMTWEFYTLKSEWCFAVGMHRSYVNRDL